MQAKAEALAEAKAAAATMAPSDKRGKKRKNATIARLNPANASVEESVNELTKARQFIEMSIPPVDDTCSVTTSVIPFTEPLSIFTDFICWLLKSAECWHKVEQYALGGKLGKFEHAL